MEWIIEFFKTFTLASLTVRMIAAVLLGGAIGFARTKQGQAAGLKTHVLVSLGASLATIIGLYTTEVLGYNNDPMRVAAQVVSGIGFLGVGTILVVGKSHIKGLTTAAGLWATACIGLACGVGFVSVAVISTLIVMITMTVVNRIEISKSWNHNEYFLAELNDVNRVNEFIAELKSRYNLVEVRVSNPKSNLPGYVSVQLVISDLSDEMMEEIMLYNQKEYIAYFVQSY